jgi:hypothetical protein
MADGRLPMGRGEFRTIALANGWEASYGERRIQNHCPIDGRLLMGRGRRVQNNCTIDWRPLLGRG